eukprot:10398149-Karenia_brevis.AAC.1
MKGFNASPVLLDATDCFTNSKTSVDHAGHASPELSSTEMLPDGISFSTIISEHPTSACENHC